jgi:hypothetical protein
MAIGRIHNPDGWVIVDDPTHGIQRIFCSWSGAYMAADRWRLSSEIINRRTEEGRIVFETASGSEYHVHSEMEGRLTGYSSMILAPALEEKRLIITEYSEE